MRLGTCQLRAMVLLAVVVLVTACSPLAQRSTGTPSTSGPSAQRAVEKLTCEAPRLTYLPAGLDARDRHLTPLSSRVLGIETTYDDGAARTVLVISGGYLDDVLEAYDDLGMVGRRSIAGERGTLLGGSHLDQEVRAVYWRQDGGHGQCDLRAIVAVNLNEATFTRVLAGIR